MPYLVFRLPLLAGGYHYLTIAITDEEAGYIASDPTGMTCLHSYRIYW
jgi:hypothetical protein